MFIRSYLFVPAYDYFYMIEIIRAARSIILPTELTFLSLHMYLYPKWFWKSLGSKKNDSGNWRLSWQIIKLPDDRIDEKRKTSTMWEFYDKNLKFNNFPSLFLIVNLQLLSPQSQVCNSGVDISIPYRYYQYELAYRNIDTYFEYCKIFWYFSKNWRKVKKSQEKKFNPGKSGFCLFFYFYQLRCWLYLQICNW